MDRGFKNKLTIDQMMSLMLSRERNSKLWRSCWKTRSWTAHGIIQSHGLRKLWKRVKNYENMCVSQLKTPQKIAKTLRKHYENVFQYFAKSSVFALPVVGVYSTTGSANTEENPRNAMHFARSSQYFCEEVLLRNLRYFANTISTFP